MSRGVPVIYRGGGGGDRVSLVERSEQPAAPRTPGHEQGSAAWTAAFQPVILNTAHSIHCSA
jgi:hypothetical protein